LMSAEEQSDESKHQQKKGWHASHSFQPSTCQSTPYERIEYWQTTTFTFGIDAILCPMNDVAVDAVLYARMAVLNTK
jgi:hypothetical protein